MGGSGHVKAVTVEACLSLWTAPGAKIAGTLPAGWAMRGNLPRTFGAPSLAHGFRTAYAAADGSPKKLSPRLISRGLLEYIGAGIAIFFRIDTGCSPAPWDGWPFAGEWP